MRFWIKSLKEAVPINMVFIDDEIIFRTHIFSISVNSTIIKIQN